ncbi:MAG TPA: hypothetical protein VN635_04060 [Conexibacter sp.]|nr:hypothetical protein [Conexibacter sp.]
MAAAALPVPAHAAFPGRNGPILYGWRYISGEERDEMYFAAGIWRISATTQHAQSIGCIDRPVSEDQNACADIDYSDPTASPDGRLVVFDTGGALALAHTDGTGLRDLATTVPAVGDPAFSPDGTRIAFVAAGSRHRGVWIVGLRTGDRARRLVDDATSPVWSSRGWIAFCRRSGIYRIRPDGSGLRRVVANGKTPAWSPHGSRLAFTRDEIDRRGRIVTHAGLFSVDIAGSRLRALARLNGGKALDIAWSPNGRQVAILDEQDLWTTDLRSGRPHGLTWAFPTGGAYSGWTYGIDWQPLP